MRHPVVEFATGKGVRALLTAVLLWCGGLTRSQAQDASGAASEPSVQKPVASAVPDNAKPGKKAKKALGSNGSASSPRAKTPKPFSFPLPPGENANHIKIPETSMTGELLSQLMAVRATRVDDEHVKMNEMNLDLYHPDGKEDFHIIMPTSIFNLKTRIITSDDPVTVRTQDFELTGEKMEFNTLDRTGRLLGKVRMLVHNLKQVAGQGDAAPKPE